MRLSVVTPPSGSVVDIYMAKRQCRVTHSDEDGLFAQYALAADSRCEDVTGRQLLEATYDGWLSEFPACRHIEVPRPNLISVSAVEYRDPGGALRTLSVDDYVVEAYAGPRADRGRISLAAGKSWPSTADQAQAVRVRFVSGYGTASAVPRSIVQGLLLTIGAWYEERADASDRVVHEVPVSARRLWRPFHTR